MNNNIDYTPEEFEKAKKWHDENRLRVNYAFPDTFIEGMRQVKNLPIQRVSGSLPTDDQIHEWVCNEFNVTALDYDEDIRTQYGYLPDYFKKFAEWLKGNDR